MAAFGMDVVSVADYLGLDDMILVGHSLGGDVAVEATLRLGDRVKGLVRISSYRSLGRPKSGQQVADWLAPFRVDCESAIEDRSDAVSGRAQIPSWSNESWKRCRRPIQRSSWRC